jgi:hypothetical protein
MIDYTVMSPGLARRLAYSLRFRSRRTQQDLSYEDLVNLQDVVVRISTKDLVLNTTISFNESDVFCSICQEDVEIYNLIRTLRCNHSFHERCINKHSKSSNKCPLCRSDIAKT